MYRQAKKFIPLVAAFISLFAYQSPAFCQQAALSNKNLPPCNLDSFVYQAGAQAEMIYGDEGTNLPPLFGFTQASRINAGITGINDAGLTTGHGSYMPDAWGADEFLAPPGEWNLSGTNHGNSMYNNAAAGLDAKDAADQATAAAQQAQSAAVANSMAAQIAAQNPDAVAADNDTDDSDDSDDPPDPNAYQGNSMF